MSSIPGSWRSPGEGNGNPLQYSCLENLMDRGAWRATVHGVSRVWNNLAAKPPPPPYWKIICCHLKFEFSLVPWVSGVAVLDYLFAKSSNTVSKGCELEPGHIEPACCGWTELEPSISFKPWIVSGIFLLTVVKSESLVLSQRQVRVPLPWSWTRPSDCRTAALADAGWPQEACGCKDRAPATVH